MVEEIDRFGNVFNSTASQYLGSVPHNLILLPDTLRQLLRDKFRVKI
jgi:hypothetical protein